MQQAAFMQQLMHRQDRDATPGSIVGVIGPNGAGKTTLFNVISGVARPTDGRIVMDGDDITRSSVPERARAGLGRTFQTSSLFPRLSVLDNVRLAAQSRDEPEPYSLPPKTTSGVPSAW